MPGYIMGFYHTSYRSALYWETGGSEYWIRYFFPPVEKIESMPWVGLSRKSHPHKYGMYNHFVSFLMVTATKRYFITMKQSDISIVNVQLAKYMGTDSFTNYNRWNV